MPVDLQAIRDFYTYLENVDLPDEVEDGFREMMEALEGIALKVDPAAIEKEKEDGFADDVSDDFLYSVIDLRHLMPGRTRKWYRLSPTIPDRTGWDRATKKKRVTFHNTAVFNGFGAWGSIVRRYLKEYDKLLAANDDIYERPDDSPLWRVKPNQELTPQEWARALALGHRYIGDPKADYNHGIPYHGLSGPNSVLYLICAFDYVTWHGNGANTDGLGFAWDAKSTKQDISDELAADLIFDVERFVEIARGEGHPAKEFEIHAMYTRKPHDPGHQYIEKVMMPAAKNTNSVIIMNEKANKKGAMTIEEVLRAAA